MTEHDHDEIARRLRESGTVPAPDPALPEYPPDPPRCPMAMTAATTRAAAAA